MADKNKEKGLDISKSRLFWRIQRECWSKMLTPYIMYLFMSMLLLATQTVETLWLRIFLGALCILASAAFNAHLTYTYGIAHYDNYLTGCIHRRNRENGIMSGGDHHPEREFAPWKGFYIGLLVGLPVCLFAGLACIPGAMSGFGRFMLVMFAGFALIPVSWIVDFTSAPASYYAYSMFLILLPIIVSGVFYLIGAFVEKRRKEAQAAREEAVRALQEQQKYEREHRVQTEEQKKKTLQSKKKK